MDEKEIKKLKEENEELKKINAVKSDLISLFAHQLRTSLTSFKWVLKMFLDGDLGEISSEQKKLLKRNFENNERMIGLVNEILNLNHTEDLILKYEFQDTQILNLVNDVLFDFTSESYKKGVELIFLKSDRVLPLVHIDSQKIRIVLENLVENAIRYSDEKDKVFISLEEKNNQIEISVKDTGIGIPGEEQVKVFDKFFRASNAKAKEQNGSGLGLFTIKGIVEKHKGQIWFESKENEGSTFYFTLPVSPYQTV